MLSRIAVGVALVVAAAALPAAAQQAPAQPAAAAAKPANAGSNGEDRYVGYYYPKPTSTETFESTMQTIQGAERPQRIQFVTVVSQGTIQSAYRVPYAVFAKGEKADKMIIVGMQQGELNTIYRMRALLANMTTMSRLSPFFQERTVAEDATFFDLLKLLGFKELTITDGEKLTHQVTIK
ncbi:MAG: molybdopterin-guanine dinucleotide biosynthesis protein A [Alphaproteobacteria bacterium]|nr:molybdopterin-guanine dinucleotide biosynthesis protein A [Alphaproteobacteria bacterium]MBV8407765.1 molybdopterin-guanine dinucleotide biosynthesis protein A [Alphaproteobacteria bacterium]